MLSVSKSIQIEDEESKLNSEEYPFRRVYLDSIYLLNATRVYAPVLADATILSVQTIDKVLRLLVVGLSKLNHPWNWSCLATATAVKVDSALNLDLVISMAVDFLDLE
jgi:hypothetical protein